MNALGMIELNSIPKGVESADAMAKAALVTLLFAQPVCAGKYIAVVSGEVDAVNASVAAGAAQAGIKLVDRLVIPNIDPQVMEAISGCTSVSYTSAVGLLETFSLAAAILVADVAVKAADIQLIEVRLGRGLGGKSFVIFTGDVAACEAAVAAAEACEEVQGLLNESVVIPAPNEDLVKNLL